MKTKDILIAIIMTLALFPAAFLLADPLTEALDAPQLSWTTGGDAPWVDQTSITYDGVDAARCGNLTNIYQSSWLETTVTGRVTVTYWWKISADSSYSSLFVQTNGSTVLWGYGEQDWRPQSISFDGGTNTITWHYYTPPSNPTNWAGNAVWLDQVSVTNITDLAPVFVLQPSATLSMPEYYHFLLTNLNALVVGDIPMTLQWQRDGTNLPAGYPFYDVDSLSLTIYPLNQAQCGGEFRLVASNAWGVVTSAVCTVSVIPSAPFVPEYEPADRVAALGGYCNLWAQVYGSEPFTFQWYTNGVPVPDATNQWYGFYPVTPADEGFYHFVVTNPQGAVTSRAAHFTVSAAPPTIVGEPSPAVSEVMPGDSAQFNVQASGPEWLYYSWRKLGETNEQYASNWFYLNNLDPTNSGFYYAIVNNYNGAVTSRVSVLAVAPVTALGLAMDAPDMAVTNYHYWYPRWTPEVNATNTHDGLCAARSPEIGDYDAYTFGVTLSGPTNLSFWWRISAGTQAFLEVSVDGSVINSISGETAWQQQRLALPAGEHQLAWTFRKEDAGQVGQDAAWVDQLVIGNSGDSGTTNYHALVAHYAFDDSGNLGVDTSGQTNDISSASGWGPQVHVFASDAVAGGGAVQFFGDSSLTAPTNVSASLVGSFTVSAWIKTTQSFGDDGYDGDEGIGVVSAWWGSETDSTIPLALTGNKAAFWTGNPYLPYDDTLHSVSDVNTNDYTHIAVTRNQSTGEKKLYVNGILEGVSFGSTRPLTNIMELDGVKIGGWFSQSYQGLLDDLQFYSGVLAVTNIAFLYSHPGETVPDLTTNAPPVITLAQALNATNLIFATDGDAVWFPQNIVSHDDVAAAQSGVIGDSGASWLETTVYGPGTLSFWWKVSSEQDADFLQLWVDGSWNAEITGEQDWTHVTLDLPAGEHLLRWLYTKDVSITNGADAAWLDQVQFAQHISASLNLDIWREADADGEHFLIFPQLQSVSSELITQHLVQSPNGQFQGAIGGEWSSSSAWMYSLESLMDECTNGVWTLFINKDDPSEQRYTFTVSISNLTTSNFGPVTIYSPADGSTNVSPNPSFHWNGPTNLPALYADFWSMEGGASGSVSLPSTATNWTTAPTLSDGTNLFRVSYTLQDADNLSYTTPVNSELQPLTEWTATTSLLSNGKSRFVVRAISGAILLNPRLTTNGFLFGLQSQNGRIYNVEARTNLTAGIWSPMTNFIGDGSLRQVTFPVTNAPVQFFRVQTE